MSKRSTATRRRSAQRPQHVTKSNVTPLYGSQSYSGTFDAQAEFVTEASLARQNKQNRSISLDWDETEGMNIDGSMRSSSGLSEQDRKDTLLQAYIQNCWISACVDVIAKRITSGGFAIEPIEQGKGDEAHRQALFDFCSLINENWDFLQFIRSIATDLLIYGECYVEIVRQGSVPVQLHKIDCMTMSYTLAQNGQITGYTQSVSHNNDPVQFDPDDIIRWWFPHPRASMKAMSPIERILNPTSADQKMVDWTHTFFRKGSKPPFWIETEGTEEEAKRFVKFMRENYTGVKNANAPVVTYGGAKLHEYNKSIIDIDFKSGRTMAREEILSVFGVPPALIGIIESGNIGGGTGDSQENSFRYNTVDPVRQMILEKLNYRVVKKGFNFDDWTIQTHYADYRSDDLVSKVQDTRLRNGMSTQNEERQAMGKHPYESMGDTPVFAVSKEVLPLDRLSELSDEQAQQSQIAISQAQAQLDMTKVQIDKAKNPPPPPPVVVAPGQPQTPANKSNNPPASPPPEEKEKQERYSTELQRGIDKINELFVRADEHLQTVRSERSVLSALSTDEKRQLLEVWTAMHSAQDARKWFDTVLPRPAMEGKPTPTREADDTPQTGIMIAFMLDPDTANQLAIPGGESPDDMHCTLAYMGTIDDEPEPGKLHPVTSIESLSDVLGTYANVSTPLKGSVGGLARFTPSPSSDGMSPVIALVNMPGLQEWRRQLVESLTAAGFSIATNFDYSPHITLSYIDADKPMPIDAVEPLPLSFNTLCLAIGDQHLYFPLTGTSPDPLPPTENKGVTNEEHPVAKPEEPATFSENRTDRTEGSQDGEPTPKRPYRRTPRTELNRWRTRALFDARSGRGLRAFESDILPVRRIHGIQTQLERVASEEAIRAVFTAAVQDEAVVEKKTTKGWRPPSDAQIDLEKKLTASIKAFIGKSKITKDSVEPPDTDAQDTLRDAIEDALKTANAEGTQIAQGTQESIVSVAKNLTDHAIQVVADIIAQIKEKAQSIIDAVLGNADIDPSDVEQEIETQVEAWAADYSEMVAQTEVHAAVEDAVLTELQASGVKKMRWVADPDACDECQHLAENDPVDVDAGEFEGGITPPAHPRCRCVIEMVDEE